MSRMPAWARVAGTTIAACMIVTGPARASDLRSWRLLADSAPFPPALGVPVGVYDPVRHRVLAIDVDYVNQSLVVHALDPGPEPRWSTLTAVGTPTGRWYLASVVYDPVRDGLLVIGSNAGQDVEVWELPLSASPTWEKLATSGTPPPPRSGHSTIYDPVHDRVILCGGEGWGSSLHGYLSDVWALSLLSDTWSELAPGGTAPGGREGHGAVYDPEGRRMMLFGGHYENGTRGFWNDLWELSLGDSVAWSEICAEGPVPGARSAFGTIYDPARRRMLVHGGVNSESGIEPDNLWAFSLDGTPVWTQIVTEDTLRGRSYPLDVYDPVEDRLLACGGGGYPQTSALSLSAPLRWSAVLPPCPLLTPGARSGHAVVHDTRRDRFLVVVGSFSAVDSAVWSFDPQSANHWQSVRASGAPTVWSAFGRSQAMVYDSLGDRIILYDGSQAWSSPAADPRGWTALGPPTPDESPDLGLNGGLVLDTRRNRLIVSGGWRPYPHGAGYTQNGVWSLSLGADPSWSPLGTVPQSLGCGGHASYYDPVGDRLVLLGGYEVNDLGRTYRDFGATVWATPVDSALVWTALSSTSGVLPPAPPKAWAAFDPRLARLFIASDSTLWARDLDDTGSWTQLESATARPTVTSAMVYDPVRDQLLALFASTPGSDDIQAWAVAMGPLSVALLGADRSAQAVTLTWSSITAYGHDATVERREESTDWSTLGSIAFDPDGLATFTDQDVHSGHDYLYRMGVADGDTTWHSDPVLVADPTSLRLALLGARPNPAVGKLMLAFCLPAAGAARLEVFDISGRRRLSRDIGAFGPGKHSVSLEGSAAWRPGVYYAQLTRGAETRTARFVLMR
jgi:hypothetical protein